MNITAFDVARRHLGHVLERQGDKDHPLIQWWLSLCGYGLDAHDEIPWCSAFVNGICWELQLPRSGSAAARSWLDIGDPVALAEAQVGWDIVILKRGDNPKLGHVGFFAGDTGPLRAATFSGAPVGGVIHLLGGNQSNQVCVKPFLVTSVVGVRRLYREGS